MVPVAHYFVVDGPVTGRRVLNGLGVVALDCYLPGDKGEYLPRDVCVMCRRCGRDRWGFFRFLRNSP